MKKFLNTCLALVLGASLIGCSSSDADTETEGGEEKVLVTFNTEGLGELAVTDDGSAPEFDEEPYQSFAFSADIGTTFTASAKADEDYKFVRWEKDGEEYSTDETITYTADAAADFIAVFTGDNGWEGEPVSDISDVKTIGDVLALPSNSEGFSGTKYAFSFELNGSVYRAIAELSEEDAQKLWDLDFDDPEYEAKKNAIIAPLAVTQLDNLTENMPTKEDTDKLAGKTGAELFGDGWYCSGWNGEEGVVYMSYREYEYEAVFEGDIDWSTLDEEKIADLTVKTIECTGIGDATYLED